MIINSIDNLLSIRQQKYKSISFKSNKKEEKQPTYKNFASKNPLVSKNQKAYKETLKLMTPPALEQIEFANKLARQYVVYKNPAAKTALITKEHFYLAFLKANLDFALEVKEEKMTPSTETQRVLPSKMEELTSNRLWEKDHIDKTIKIIRKEINKQIKELEKKSTKKGFVTSLELDNEFGYTLKQHYELLKTTLKTQNINLSSLNDTFIFSILDSLKNTPTNTFLQNLSKGIMIKEFDSNDTGLSFYNNLSKNLINNIDKNYNVYVNYSSKDDKAPQYFINSLNENLQKEETYKNCKNFNKNNTKLIVFNELANFTTIVKELNAIDKDKDKNYIVVFSNYCKIFANSARGVDSDGYPLMSNSELNSIFKYCPKNVHYVFIDNRDNYYSTINDEFIGENYSNFQPLQIPILDSNAAKNELIKNREKLEKELGIKLDIEAIKFACSLSNTNQGSTYDKALKFLKNAALYYQEEPVLKKEHLSAYFENSQKEELNSKEGSYNIIFDTKTTPKDIKGSPMTKAQIEQAAYEIKNYPKTKGYLIYCTQEGGGRFKAAKALAGAASIPMVTINAADYAIRDLDTISKDPMEAIEAKITKLTNLMKTQAQTNPNKTVMLFISNFDRFASPHFSSMYEQQAFKKLIEEMKKSNTDKTYNIVVIGSCDYPQLIDENIRRKGLFLDEIAVYPPQGKKDIVEIALDYIKKNNYSIEGQTNIEKSKVLAHFASVVDKLSYVDIVDILDKANLIAKKNGKDSISKKDINEAYLTKTLGPANNYELEKKQKELIIRHEGAHALNLQFMYNLLKQQGDTIRIPDSIVNIALDPRGDFLGCVFHQNSPENLQNNNLETIFSSMVCAFAGNSSESHFYNQQGSWGISQDLEGANDLAKFAVLNMGLGKDMNYYKPDIDPRSGLPVLGFEDEKNYNKDVKVLLENAKILSDKIVKCYEDFLVEFSDEFVDKFATGNCILTGTEFKKRLFDWEKRQDSKKRKEIYTLKKEAMLIIELTRESKKYQNIHKINPFFRLT